MLNDYKAALEQRNNYLKQIVNEKKAIETLDIWDEQLANLSYQIYQYRQEYVEKIKEKITKIHRTITETKDQKEAEEITLKYISTGDTKAKFLENIQKAREIDIKRGFTSIGIHRDEMIIYINHKPVARFGSQGQQRTTILSLKLAELQVVSDEIGDAPILLLDDFMSELDEKRRKVLLEKIKENQVIITCTDRIELKENKNTKFFLVEKRQNKRKGNSIENSTSFPIQRVF